MNSRPVGSMTRIRSPGLSPRRARAPAVASGTAAKVVVEGKPVAAITWTLAKLDAEKVTVRMTLVAEGKAPESSEFELSRKEAPTVRTFTAMGDPPGETKVTKLERTTTSHAVG